MLTHCYLNGEFMRFSSVLAFVFVLFTGAFSASLGSASEATPQLSVTIKEFVTILVNTPVAKLRSKGLPDRR